MLTSNITVSERMVNKTVAVLDIAGEVNAGAEGPLTSAFNLASDSGARTIILNFAQLKYMNSTGIGVLVTLLIRASRQKQRLLAYGLNDHYRQIFKLTRLDEAIGLYDTEEKALQVAG